MSEIAQIESENFQDSLLLEKFNGLNVQIYGTYEEPLFKAKDIGNLLGIEKNT
jgi:prophage antirepressor-like protein